jgi:hypothetical protein
MRKLIFSFLIFIFLTYSIYAQKFDFPDVRNTVPSVQTAFLALLHNMAYLSEKSTMVDHIKYENTNIRYIEYIDFVLNNITFEKTRNYFLRISQNVERIDYSGLSRKQQEDFEYFLQTAIVDNWTFGTGWVDFVNLPMIENSNINLGVFNERIMQEQNNIANYETQLNALPDLAYIQKKIDDAVKEYRELQSSTPRTARAVQNRVNRLDELKDIEMNERRQYWDVSAQINSLTSRISSARTNIRNIELQREREISNSREKVIQNYIKNLHDNINNFYQWKDFFDNKNTVIKDFLIAIDIRGHLIRIIDEYIPQRQVPTYQNLLTIFLNGWGI